jgi:hypothetical protein
VIFRKKLWTRTGFIWVFFYVHFIVGFSRIKERIDLKQLLKFDNWNHVAEFSFFDCGWFDDDDWRTLVGHAGNFNNLTWLRLGKCLRSKFRS